MVFPVHQIIYYDTLPLLRAFTFTIINYVIYEKKKRISMFDPTLGVN